jgi:hypothetical protein
MCYTTLALFTSMSRWQPLPMIQNNSLGCLVSSETPGREIFLIYRTAFLGDDFPIHERNKTFVDPCLCEIWRLDHILDWNDSQRCDRA